MLKSADAERLIASGMADAAMEAHALADHLMDEANQAAQRALDADRAAREAERKASDMKREAKRAAHIYLVSADMVNTADRYDEFYERCRKLIRLSRIDDSSD